MFVAGQSIGNYKILSKIGTGGMGAVYLAEHPLIGKRVALKVIHRELAGNRDVVNRFFQEARAVNKIGHANIVEIHDFAVTPEGDHFYIMEYLVGRTLASIIGHEHILDPMRALHITAQMASALSAAHASGVIHRDLKPDNIMLIDKLGDPDFVKVLDFGLAKMFAGGDSAVKTALGVILGTPQYMSPEACESKRDIDHRTDIYALGILLFQMLTGQLPFDGESMGEVLVKQVTGLPPAPRGINPRIPPSIEQIVLRCLAKAPDARFPTMNALRDAVLDPESYLGGSPPMAPARSVAPGEARIDAPTMIAYAAANAANQQTRIGISAPLPLQAPPTLTNATGASGMGRAQTASEVFAAQMATQIAQAPRRTGAVAVPGLVQPAEPMNRTMRIDTPVGYTSRPPKRMWPMVLVVGLLLGLGGGAFAVAWFGRGGGGKATAATGAGGGSGSAATASVAVAAAASGSGSGNGSGKPITGNGSATPSAASGSAAPAVVATSGSGTVSAPAAGSASATPITTAGSGSATKPTATPLTAMIAITTIPAGADVVGPDHNIAGKTPLHLELPISTSPVTIELRLPGYRVRTKELVIAGDSSLSVELERMPAAVPSANPNPNPSTNQSPTPPRPKHKTGDELLRPEDL